MVIRDSCQLCESWACAQGQPNQPRIWLLSVRSVRWQYKFSPADIFVRGGQGSSLGSYTPQWLNEFHWSARGESAEDWLDKTKKSREKLPFPSVKIVFPSKATVKSSAMGEQVCHFYLIIFAGHFNWAVQGGGTIFCRRKQWDAKNCPKDLFYDSKSKGGPVLMHSKVKPFDRHPVTFNDNLTDDYCDARR